MAPGGGLIPAPVPSTALHLAVLLKSRLWNYLPIGHDEAFHTAIFQPVGGMNQIARAMYRKVADGVQFGARVTAIDQGPQGVTVNYADTSGGGSGVRQVKADWCLCSIPLSILSQIDIKVSDKMHAAIEAVP